MPDKRPVRIANSSGFYGDRMLAAKEMVEGGPIDFLTGDYLAELTMLILWKSRLKDPTAGYARTFLAQMEQVLGTCLDRGIRIVTNAGGLNPGALAEDLGKLAANLGLNPKIAHIEGDDLMGRIDDLLTSGHRLSNLDTGEGLKEAGITPITANAYLGARGIVRALEADAQVIICPRVTDASLVVGPAAWWHGWGWDELDRLAGAVVAGHIIECGPQATGGNYSWIDEIEDKRYPGFPIAEVANDGSSIITKHEDTGGLVSVGTVTAQLMYEIAEPEYVNPDVVAHFDQIHLTQVAPDRVLVSGTKGSPPPSTLKVAINYHGGFRNSMTMLITGLDIEKKAEWATDELFSILGGRDSFSEVDVRLTRFDRPDADSSELATAQLRISVKDQDPKKVGRQFSNAMMELALGGYAGFHTTTPPTPESAFGVYWPTLIPADLVTQKVWLPDGRTVIADPPSAPSNFSDIPAAVRPQDVRSESWPSESRRLPLGTICAARSGDKGGNANVGLWTREQRSYTWLESYLTIPMLKQLLPEAERLEIKRFSLPNLWAINFVIIGLLGEGVASSTRPDPQAKGLGEFIRSRSVDIPVVLLGEG